MSLGTLTDCGVMQILECGVCHVRFAMTESLYRECKDEGKGFWCPRGCSLVFTTSENQRLKREVERLAREKQSAKDDAAWHERQRRKTERQLSAQKGVVTKIKKRIGNGVCPCCTRHFTNLEQHMRNKHPDYSDAETVAK